MDPNIPDNANEHCPGTSSQNAGKGDACKGCPNQKICTTNAQNPQTENLADPALQSKLAGIKNKILVLSGKGGVGKSTVSSQIAFGLASQGFEVGLLDLDLCGPSIPRTMGLEGQEVHKSSDGWSPVFVTENLAVMSIGFLLPSKDDAVIWRGPKKNGLIKQFLVDVDWGELDFLIVDTPPGTSDEHISIVQYLNMDSERDGAILVTTGQKLSVNDVRKEINFCKKTNVNILGIVENMRDFICGHCGERNDLFHQKDMSFVEEMCTEYNIDYIGGVSFSKDLLLYTENGKSLFDSENPEIEQNIFLKTVKQDFNNIIQTFTKKVGATHKKVE
jgi:Mrp family chromosome partitioning ATPase